MTLAANVADDLRRLADDLRELDVHGLRERLLALPLQERLGCLPSLDPTPMDTLGSLIDKLVTVNLKMWHNQELLYEIRRMSPEEFQSRWGAQMDGLHGVIKRCCDLNVQRSRLMDAIDHHFRDTVEGRRDAHVMDQHKTY